MGAALRSRKLRDPAERLSTQTPQTGFCQLMPKQRGKIGRDRIAVKTRAPVATDLADTGFTALETDAAMLLAAAPLYTDTQR